MGSAFRITVNIGFMICDLKKFSFVLLYLKCCTNSTIVTKFMFPSWMPFFVLMGAPRPWYNCAGGGGKLYLILLIWGVGVFYFC